MIRAEVFLMRNRGCVATSKEIELMVNATSLPLVDSCELTKRVASLHDLSHPAGCEALAEAKTDKRAYQIMDSAILILLAHIK